MSQQIRVLENKYGVSFFERGGRKFAITPEGEAFAESARNILAAYDNITPKLKGMRQSVNGTLRISTLHSVGLYELTDFLRHFREDHPEVEVAVEYKRSQQIYDDVKDGRADLGLVSFPQRTRGFVLEVFKEEPMVVICSPNHRLAKRKRIKLQELNDEEFVYYTADTQTHRVIEKVLKDYPVKLGQQHEFESIETVVRAVSVTNMLSVVPQGIVEKEVEQGELIALKMEDSHLQRPLAIVTKQGKNLSPAVAEFRRLLMRE